MTYQTADFAAWIGHEVVDRSGEKIGKVTDIFVDDQTSRPEWLTVSTGLFGRRSSFVPVDAITANGDQVVVSFDKALVKDAPQVDDDGDGHLSPDEEDGLHRYYDHNHRSETGPTSASVAPAASNAETGTGTVGYDTSGPTTDRAMTRSEERINVGTRTTESGRVRLRKYVVTEQVTQTVPVSHEEIRVERDPITDANRPAATDGPAISEEEHEVILHEERPVVEKEVVPVERVRLSTETVTGEEIVSDEVRKERIEQESTDRPPR
jgi:uncharacterized protein (TIGR02271 family)